MARKNKRNMKNKNSGGLTSIQWAGIAIIVVIIAVAVWYFLINQQPVQTQTAIATEAPLATQVPSVAQSSSTQASSAVAVPTVKNLQWTSAPAMTIDTTKQYFATITMAKGGVFVIQLYANKAPITVNSFVFLAQQGFYNGVTFHRVLDGFMAQGGDPTGTGGGGPGYQYAYEPNDLKFDKAGVVAMANTGPATPTNGSQFFITFAPQPSLDGGYTIFGQVISGMDVINGITRRDPAGNPPPTTPGDAMASVTISTK
ncbi:MAG: peptidylprolyl isomerase [Anaerolineales bacterium]